MSGEGWLVIGYDPSQRYRGWTACEFTVHREPGESVKDVQDKTAALAEARPQIIYTVVPEAEYRARYREVVERWMGGPRRPRRRGRR